jgi:hypothetical protein
VCCCPWVSNIPPACLDHVTLGGGKGPVRTPAPIGYYYEPGPDGCALLLPIVFSDAKRGAFCLPGGSYIRIETFGYCYYSSD